MNSIITVVTPAETSNLTTLERVKLELSIYDGASDELLLAKIAEASSDIAVRCGPMLRRETVTETFYTDHYRECAPALILTRRPVAAIIDRTVDDELIAGVIVDGVGLAAGEYRVKGENGLLYRSTALGFRYGWEFCQSIAVTYSAGYMLPGQAGRDLPASLEAACVELVSSYWASRGRDPTLKAEENVGVARFEYWIGSVGEAGDLPPGVMQKIQPYLLRGAFA